LTVAAALDRSIVAAVARGSATSGGIANSLGRPATSLAHPPSTRERAPVLVREEGLLAQRRPWSRIADPLFRFEAAMIRPPASGSNATC